MTLEIDLERVGEVTTRLDRHRATVDAIRLHLTALGQRAHLTAEVAPAVAAGERLTDRLALTAVLLTRRAEQAGHADSRPDLPLGDELRSFAGGSVLCSAIQLASPIPARPSTSGVTGAIDAAGVVRDAASIVDAAPSTVAGRAVPLATIAAAFADTVLCRLRVGSGAAISTRTIVDEHGQQVYEGSRSPHKHQVDTGEPLASDLERRDRQMWRVEHLNQLGHVTVPYPGYPAYEVNAPRR
jgi:hypothetical protein